MTAYVLLFLYGLCLQHAVADAAEITKREVLTDLSGGFCRSWKFGANIVNDVLYMVGLDGGNIPHDKDGSHNYMVELDLKSSFSTNDGSKFKMSLVDTDVPKLKDQALWSDQANKTLYMYGGRGASNTSADEGLWSYSIADQSWKLQQTSIKPVQLVGGGYTNAPAIQAAYWLGGYQSKDTSLGITDDTLDFATGMIQFNTTTGVVTQLDAPFTPVQQGALVYMPVGELGVLVYFGGEVPSEQKGINMTLTPNAWDYVQIYDIAAGEWYNQTTTGNVTSRTEFCAVVQHEPESSSFEIYIIGGADFESQETLSDVSFLSIPSFKWYRAAGLSRGRMSLACESYGRQIFGIGGRYQWADEDSQAGCYRMPAFVYDSVSEVVRTDFYPELPSYTVNSATANEIERSPYPESWNDPAVARLFDASSNSTNSTEADKATASRGSSTAPIIGGVVGGVGGALVIVAGLGWLFIRRRRKQRAAAPAADAVAESGGDSDTKGKHLVGGELPPGTLQEMESAPVRSELVGDNTAVHELGTENHR